MTGKSGVRVLVLAIVLCAVTTGSMALHIKNQEQELLRDFTARSQRLVREGKFTEARELLIQANELDPERAWLRTLRVRTLLAAVGQETKGLAEAALAALEALPSPPARARQKPLHSPSSPSFDS